VEKTPAAEQTRAAAQSVLRTLVMMESPLRLKGHLPPISLMREHHAATAAGAL
jgi:hypothetical protein